MLVPALVLPVIVVLTAAPVAIAVILVFITVAIMAVVAVRPVAPPTLRSIAILVAELEGIPVILA